MSTSKVSSICRDEEAKAKGPVHTSYDPVDLFGPAVDDFVLGMVGFKSLWSISILSILSLVSLISGLSIMCQDACVVRQPICGMGFHVGGCIPARPPLVHQREDQHLGGQEACLANVVAVVVRASQGFEVGVGCHLGDMALKVRLPLCAYAQLGELVSDVSEPIENVWEAGCLGATARAHSFVLFTCNAHPPLPCTWAVASLPAPLQRQRRGVGSWVSIAPISLVPVMPLVSRDVSLTREVDHTSVYT